MITDHKLYKFKSIEKAYEEELKYITGRQNGTITSLKSQYEKLNKVYMDGFEWGWIVTIGGMSGSGKTAFLNSLETGFFENNINDFAVLNLNFEMLSRRLLGRKISSALNKSVRSIYSVDMQLSSPLLSHIGNMRNKLTNFDVTYVEEALTVDEIEDYIETFINIIKKRGKSKLVVTLDHALLVKNPTGLQERTLLNNLMKKINDIKKRHDIIFIILSQVNRSLEESDRITNPKLHYPRKADLFGSDALFQFSDAVMIFHRPEMLGITSYGVTGLETKEMVYIHNLKTRDGVPMISAFKSDLKNNKLIETNVSASSSNSWE